ncbi:HD domain-containing phosphohydrolase [Pararhodospirillum oryzae]|uniref:Two-component system response regulator n=1 Tax=Pararhodospirillum oryzae TaxID=478448 RepID=A0A512H8R4_9PROT|nr:HD domain-containing phosphohydrolase [Pararhodospirillum oryzae]GEO81847.1 two-component system response regulator [Pararhodospirillum oryzae]
MHTPLARIVIVDDSDSVLRYLTHLVTKFFGEGAAIAFSDPLAALPWCLVNEVDLIVVDNVMPGLSGLQMIEKLRQQGCNTEVPIVMVTTCDTKDVRYTALQVGATDFLQKPVDRIEFMTRLNNLLQLGRHIREAREHAAHLADEVRKATRSILEREREAILALSCAAEFRDNETGSHLVRMATSCRIIGLNLGLGEDDIELLFGAAPMHDVGKIGIPDHVLLKPGKLTEEEREIMMTHAQIGWEILSKGKSRLMQMGADIALCHHERWDGTGYPNGLAGTDIPLPARICAVADVFDALISRRPYKEPWPVDDALAFLIENSGTHFDPACVDAFMKDVELVLHILGKFTPDEELAGFRVLR